MREILFRGKKETLTEKNKGYTDGWIYGDTLYKDDSGVYLIPFGVSAESYHLGPYDFRANSDRFEIMVAKIKSETLGQYVGLKDKNGRMIFEGDFVRDVEGGIYKVVYDTEYMRFAFEQAGINWGLVCFDSVKDFEVIGNIYDNYFELI